MKKFNFNLQRFDNISNSTANTVITAATLTDSVTNSADFVTISSGGKIYNTGNNVSMQLGTNAATIENYGVNVTVEHTDYHDYSFVTHVPEVIALPTKIYSDGGDNSTFSTGGSADNINVMNSNYVTISTGGGADTISISQTENVTINPGAGNDEIILDDSAKNTFIDYDATSDRVGGYTYTISGFNADDTLSIDFPTGGSGSAYQAYYDSVINVTSSGSDIRVEVPNYYILGTNVSGGERAGDTILLKNVGANVTAANFITSGAASISWTVEELNYSGGNQNISNYSGEKINYTADFTGLGFSATDFILKSSTGTLTIQNAVGKFIDVAVGGNTVAHAYLSSGGGAIDRSNYSTLEVILGANNSDNNIFAGSGGSSLWGGVGGSDILNGGAGEDEFFFGKSDGADVINNAGSADVINLYDVSLSDITDANISDNLISLNLASGGSLQINSAENLSATFKLADGSAWKFNHSSNAWQNA